MQVGCEHHRPTTGRACSQRTRRTQKTSGSRCRDAERAHSGQELTTVDVTVTIHLLKRFYFFHLVNSRDD